MSLTKIWLKTEIFTEPNPAIKLALERVFLKFTEPPTKGNSNSQSTLKEFDRDETYKKIVTFYIEKKGYTKDQAHDMAMHIVNREIARRKLK